MSEARSRAREAIDMTNDSRQAGAMETFINSPDGAYLDAVKEKAREIDAQLAAEQAASCRLREALETVRGEYANNVHVPVSSTNIAYVVLSALEAAPGPCVHQRRAEALTKMVIKYARHTADCRAYTLNTQRCTCGVRELVRELKAAALAGAAEETNDA